MGSKHPHSQQALWLPLKPTSAVVPDGVQDNTQLSLVSQVGQVHQ